MAQTQTSSRVRQLVTLNPAAVLDRPEVQTRPPYNAGRHAFASYHLAQHAPEDTAKQLGHTKTDLLFTTYRGLVTKKAATSFWAIRPKRQKHQGTLVVLKQQQAS